MGEGESSLPPRYIRSRCLESLIQALRAECCLHFLAGSPGWSPKSVPLGLVTFCRDFHLVPQSPPSRGGAGSLHWCLAPAGSHLWPQPPHRHPDWASGDGHPCAGKGGGGMGGAPPWLGAHRGRSTQGPQRSFTLMAGCTQHQFGTFWTMHSIFCWRGKSSTW